MIICLLPVLGQLQFELLQGGLRHSVRHLPVPLTTSPLQLVGKGVNHHLEGRDDAEIWSSVFRRIVEL